MDLIYPSYPFKIKKEAGKPQIFDEFRRKWVALTPEEWVRQHLLVYLKTQKKVPSGLIAVETSITLNGMQRRCDAVIYDASGQALCIIECKATTVPLSQLEFDQVWNYNRVLKVPMLVLSNGLQQIQARIDASGMPEFLQELPDFKMFS